MRLPSGYLGLFFFALCLAIGFGGNNLFGDPDTGWHLAAGDLIRASAAVPQHDSWSFASGDEQWFNLSWLYDVGLSALFAQGDFAALYIVTIVLFAASFTWMAHHCIQRGANIIIVCALLFLAMLVSWGSVLVRPQMVSLLLTMTSYQLLASYRDGKCRRKIFALPLVLMLWANLHGAFLLALVMTGIFMLEALLQCNRPAARGYGAVLALCLAATLVNPFGYGVYLGAYRTLSGTFDRQYLIEWQSAKIGQDIPLTILLLLMLMSGKFLDKRIALSDRILSVFTLVLALGSLRHATVAMLLSMPYLSQAITSLLDNIKTGERIKHAGAATLQDMGKKDVQWMGLFLGAVAVCLLASPLPRDMVLKQPLGFPKDNFPAKEAAFVEQNYPGLRFMTDYNLGGWLDYIWRGRVKVFVDGRSSSLYSPETLQHYADFANVHHGAGGRAEMIANYYHFDGLIIANDDPWMSEWEWNPKWKKVYRDKAATVFISASRHADEKSEQGDD